MTASQSSSEPSVIVDFPLRGEWLAINTPAERIPSHGTNYFGQRYAYDFRKYVSHNRLPYKKQLWHHIVGQLKAWDCYSWNQPVYAPISGEVIALGDGWPDRTNLNLFRDLLRILYFPSDATPTDYRPLTGNYVMIKGNVGVALLAHLRCGSLRISKRQMISVGDLIGEVGNSGNSSMPHLHFQIMECSEPFQAKGILCKFSKYERLYDGIWELMSNAIPNRNEVIRVT